MMKENDAITKSRSNSISKKEVTKEVNVGLIKGVIGTIPFIGTMVNETLFDIRGRIYQKRINTLVKILSEKMQNIEENKINYDYLKSEDFFDITREVFESALKIKSMEKRQILSEIYIDSIINKNDFNIDKNKLFISFIVSLSPLQLIILKFIETNSNKLVEIGSYKKFYNMFIETNNFSSLDKYEFKYYCNDLENKSVVTFGDGLEDFESKSERYVSSEHKEASVSITSLGKEFLKFLICEN